MYINPNNSLIQDPVAASALSVIVNAGNNKIPVVPETHNPSNVRLYEHFGFTLVKNITHPCTEIKQYCMIRYPEETTYMQRA